MGDCTCVGAASTQRCCGRRGSRRRGGTPGAATHKERQQKAVGMHISLNARANPHNCLLAGRLLVLWHEPRHVQTLPPHWHCCSGFLPWPCGGCPWPDISTTPTCRTDGHISAMWVLGSLLNAAVSPGCDQGHSFQLCGVVRVHSLICKPNHKHTRDCGSSTAPLWQLGMSICQCQAGEMTAARFR